MDVKRPLVSLLFLRHRVVIKSSHDQPVFKGQNKLFFSLFEKPLLGKSYFVEFKSVNLKSAARSSRRRRRRGGGACVRAESDVAPSELE